MSKAQPNHRVCNLCEAMCGIEVTVSGDKIAIKPDANDPFSKGSMCPKAPALAALHTDPDRLRRPVRKVGETWQEIEWSEAYDLGIVVWIVGQSERALPETDFRWCVQNEGGQDQSSG